MSERAVETRELSLAELLARTKARLDRETDEIRLAELTAPKGERRSLALAAIQKRKDQLRLDRIGLDEAIKVARDAG